MSEHKSHFNAETAALLASTIVPVYSQFDSAGFVKEVEAEMEGLEIKDRVMKMAIALKKRLPANYPEAVQVLVDSLGDEIEGQEGMFTEGWYLMPIARFVEEFGHDHWRESMDAINEITRRHTGEYAVRPYLEIYPEQTIELFYKWALHENHHVRRMVSEGMRPRLPWALQLKQFVKEPAPVLRILELLRSDESEYVRKSVGNSLNDVSKDHPELVLATAERWLKESPTENTRYIVKRGLRTLAQKNHPQALKLLGFTGGEHIALVEFALDSDQIKIGDALDFSITIHNQSEQSHQLTLNYAVHLVRQNGRRNIKVFKLGTRQIEADEMQQLSKSQSFKPIKLRKYYPGMHQINIVINGLVKATAEFELLRA